MFPEIMHQAGNHLHEGLAFGRSLAHHPHTAANLFQRCLGFAARDSQGFGSGLRVALH